jgi:nicotinamidase-related amidase
MDLTSTALVVIDMQRGFVHPNSAYVVPVVTDLVRRWQDAGGATVFTRFINAPGSQFERLLQWRAVSNPPQTDIVDELAPHLALATAVIDKPAYTLFTAEGAGVVARGGWSDLVFCGLTTESCVLKSAVDAFEHGLTPWVLTDASATHAGPAAQEAGLLVTRRFIGSGQLITTDDIHLAPGELTCTAPAVRIAHHITDRVGCH